MAAIYDGPKSDDGVDRIPPGETPLPREYFPIPESWIANGSHTAEQTERDEERYYATVVCLERAISAERTSPRETDYSETASLFVKYVNDTGTRAIERQFEAAMVERDGQLVTVPKRVRTQGPEAFPVSLGVAPSEGKPVRVSEQDRELLRERYGIDVDVGDSA